MNFQDLVKTYSQKLTSSMNGLGNLVQPTSKFISSAWDTFKSGPQSFGTGLGESIQNTLFRVPQMQTTVSQMQAQNNTNLQAIKKMREAGNIEGAKRLAAQNLKGITQSGNLVNQEYQNISNRGTIGKITAGGAKTALTALGAGAPMKALAGTALLGTGLGGGLALASKQDPFVGAGKGFGSTFELAGLNKLTAPLIDPWVASSQTLVKSGLGRLATRGTAMGLANVVEDELYTRATTNKPPTVNDRVFSFVLGAGTAPFTKYDPNNSFFEIVDDKAVIKKQYRDNLGRYATKLNMSPKKLKNNIDKLGIWLNEPEPLRIYENGELKEVVAPRWKAVLKDQGGYVTLPGKEKKPQSAAKVRPGEVEQIFRSEKFNLNQKQTKTLDALRKSLGFDTRKVRTFDDMRAMAEELGADPKKLLRDIQTNRITDAEVIALGDTISTSSQRIAKLQQLLKKSPSDKDLIQKLNIEEQILNTAIAKRIRGGTEGGRTVVAFKNIANKTLDPAYWLTRAQKQLGESRQLKPDEVTAINELINSKDRLGLAKFISLLGESSVSEKAVAIWKAGLLSSPRTHIANVLSNTIFAPLETIKDIPATGFDIARSAITGSPRAKSFGARSVTSQGEGAVRGLKQAGTYLKEGVDPRDVAKLDTYKAIRFGNSKGGRFAQKYVNGVFSLLGAEDKVFREIAFNRSIADQALTTSKNTNLSAAQLNDLLLNPTEEMVKRAAKDAGIATFNNENALSEGLRRFKSGNKFLSTGTDFVMPFVRTPTNVLLRMLDYTPVGVTKTTVQKIIDNKSVSNREMSEAFGRSVTGLGVLWAGYKLAEAGKFQGPTPATEPERSQMYLEGKNPGSILVNGTWYQINKLSPVYPLLAIGATYFESGSLGQAGLQGVKSVADSPFVQGLAGVTGAINDPEKGGKKYITSAVGGVVPNVIKDLARGGDVMRQPDTLTDAVTVGLPGLRQNLPVRVDALGNAIPENNLTNSLLNPLRPREASNDPLVNEFTRIGYNLNYIGNTIGNVKLSPEQERAYQRLAGAKIREMVLPLIESDIYLSSELSQQQNMVEKAVVKAKAAAREEIKPKLGSITPGSDRGAKARAFEDQTTENKTKLYIEGFVKDPFGTTGAIASGQPIRKIRGNTVVLERQKGLASEDQGNKGTQVDHITALGLGGSNSPNNRYILTADENAKKGQVETYLMGLLENGEISKSEAQKRAKDWRNEYTKIQPKTPKQAIKQEMSYVDEKGETKVIDMSPIKKPELTGSTELDKKMLSKFNSQITSKSNDILSLYQSGKLSTSEAETQLQQLKDLKDSYKSSGTKTKKLKKIKPIKIKIPKTKMIKVKALKLKKPKKIKVKIKKIKKRKILTTKA